MPFSNCKAYGIIANSQNVFQSSTFEKIHFNHDLLFDWNVMLAAILECQNFKSAHHILVPGCELNATYIYIYIHIHIYIHTCIYIYMYIYIYTHTYIYIYIYIYIYTQVHKAPKDHIYIYDLFGLCELMQEPVNANLLTRCLPPT